MRVAVWLCFCILGQTAPGASFGADGPTVLVEGVQPRGVPLWSKGRQRAPRDPLLRQFPPRRANPRSSGLTNFTAHCSYCTSDRTSASHLHSRSNTSPRGPSVVPVTPSQRVNVDFLLLMTLRVPMQAVAHLQQILFT